MIIVLFALLNHQMNYTCTYCNVRRGIWTMMCIFGMTDSFGYNSVNLL